jgi:hypothetical protein
MPAMVTAAGLALDIIGAVLVLAGLFRHPRGTTLGWAHPPRDAAADHAFGATGGLFLVSGFVCQILGIAGLGGPAAPSAIYRTALIAFLFGLVLAYLLFGVIYMLFMMLEVRWVERQPGLNHLDAGWEWKRRPRRQKFWLEFWHYEMVRNLSDPHWRKPDDSPGHADPPAPAAQPQR